MSKTPVSILQELTVQKKLAIPDYQVQGTGKPHCMSFTCQVKTGHYTAEGVGGTKQEAKHNAAKNMLNVFGVDLDSKAQMSYGLLPSKRSKVDLIGPTINYIGKLNEFSSGHRYPQPSYTENITIQDAQFCIICTFNQFKTEGYGSNKKDAKQDAARAMLALIRDTDLSYNPVETVAVDKLEENDEISKQVVEKYSELIKNMNITNDRSENNNEPTLAEKVNISTWEELTALLDKRGYVYELKTMQKFPLILSLKINDFVLMNCDKKREDILSKFVIDVVRMIENGVDFTKSLLES